MTNTIDGDPIEGQESDEGWQEPTLSEGIMNQIHENALLKAAGGDRKLIPSLIRSLNRFVFLLALKTGEVKPGDPEKHKN